MLLVAIWPVFALICLGYVLGRRAFPSAGFWPAAERLNYFLLFPALLVSSLAEAPVDDPALLRLGAAAVATILAAAGLLWLVRRLWSVPVARFGPALQGVVRFNTYLALSILGIVAGADGLSRAAVYLAISVPLVNVLSIMALSEAGVAQAPRALLRTIGRNPLILACLAGIGLALSGVGLPFGIGSFLSLLGQGSLPLGLLCVGAGVAPASVRQDLAGLVGVGAVRLGLMPVLATGTGLAFGLSGVEALVLVVFSAVPTAPTSYVLTRQMDGDGPFMAGIVTSQTLAAVVTLPLVLLVFDVL